eukprot:4622895-Pleurochrysis_carterae.AAC.1
MAAGYRAVRASFADSLNATPSCLPFFAPAVAEAETVSAQEQLCLECHPPESQKFVTQLFNFTVMCSSEDPT